MHTYSKLVVLKVSGSKEDYSFLLFCICKWSKDCIILHVCSYNTVPEYTSLSQTVKSKCWSV